MCQRGRGFGIGGGSESLANFCVMDKVLAL